MENYKDIVNKINLIIEQSNVDNPKCKNCISYNSNISSCTFGLEHRKNMNKYLFARKQITSPDYSCDNFKPVYSLSENTVDVLRDMVRDIEKVNEDIMNLELMLDGKIDENEFVELVK
jgi:hypothetical protein